MRHAPANPVTPSTAMRSAPGRVNEPARHLNKCRFVRGATAAPSQRRTIRHREMRAGTYGAIVGAT